MSALIDPAEPGSPPPPALARLASIMAILESWIQVVFVVLGQEHAVFLALPMPLP